MLTLKQTIRNSPELQMILRKSVQKRRKYFNKNQKHCEKSKEYRDLMLRKEYPLKSIIRGRQLFPILLFLMRMRLKLSGIKIVSLNNYCSDSDKPVIFVPTHIAKFDIEVVYACIKSHALLLCGTEDRMHGRMDGFFLEKNGVNYVDRSDKRDRANALKKMELDLFNGFNLLWFVEGTWNLSANQLVYDISYSVINMALKCNVSIVPIGLNQIDNSVYIKFGSPYSPDVKNDLTDSVMELRDIMATLKWDIYEFVNETRKDGFIYRALLDDNYWPDYLIERIKEWPMTDLEEEMNYVYHPKDEAHSFFEEYRSSTCAMEVF